MCSLCMSLAEAITVFPSITKVLCSLGAADLMANWVMETATLDMSPLELPRWKVPRCFCLMFQLLPVSLSVSTAASNCEAGVSVNLAAGGTHHSAAVTDGGLVYTWGCASSGHLGVSCNISHTYVTSKSLIVPNTLHHTTHTGQLGHRPSSPKADDDQQMHFAQFLSSPQVVKMFKGVSNCFFSSFTANLILNRYVSKLRPQS